jgi:hypothetical protein
MDRKSKSFFFSQRKSKNYNFTIATIQIIVDKK